MFVQSAIMPRSFVSRDSVSPMQRMEGTLHMEKTQEYNLSLGASAHDQMVAAKSTRRASISIRRPAKDEG